MGCLPRDASALAGQSSAADDGTEFQAMSTASPLDDSREPAVPRAFSVPFPRPWWQRGLVAAFLVVLFSAVGYVAATEHPDASPPQGSEVEAKIAHVFGVPRDGVDDRIVGDLLVERFYVLDAETGSRYVCDLMKGRISSVQTSTIEGGLQQYTLVLNLQNLNRDNALYAAFVEDVARPREPGVGEYLGLRTPNGLTDAFLINYSGILPEKRLPFSSEDGENLREFLGAQRYAQVTQSPQLIGVEGYNYLLSNTDLFPFFRTEFGIGKAIFVSELMVVDTTAPEQQRTYFKLTEKYPRTTR
jgi:hypothetical protein